MAELRMSLVVLLAVLTFSCTSTTYTQHPRRLACNLIFRQTVTTNQSKHYSAKNYSAKNSKNIFVFDAHQRPTSAYRIIGVARVSKFNLIGRERNDAVLHDMLKELAASIGGDALINLDNTAEALQGNVIQFQRILL